MVYNLAVYKNENGGFNGVFADFECVVNEGDTLDELIANAKELLNFTLADMVEHGIPLPVPSPESKIRMKLDCAPFRIVPVAVSIRANGSSVPELF